MCARDGDDDGRMMPLKYISHILEARGRGSYRGGMQLRYVGQSPSRKDEV